MHHRVIKRLFTCLLMVTLLTSSLSFANIDSHLKDLDLEDTIFILRTLNNKFKVDWISVKSNHPKRREETQKILSCLTFILDERVKKINSLFVQKKEIPVDPTFNKFLENWYCNKIRTCNEIRVKLQCECDNSYSGDLFTFELLRPFPIEIEDSIIDDFVMVDPTDSCEVYFPPKPRIDLFPEDMISTSSVMSPMPVVRSSMSRIPSELSKKPLNSRERPSKSRVNSLPEVGSSSMSVRRPSKSSKKSLNSSRRPSEPIVNSLPLLGSSSTSTDMSTALAAVPSTSADTSSSLAGMPSTSTVHNDLLKELDKESAEIILKSILNGYRIPSKEFALMSKTEQEDRYGKVVAYLMWVLHNKEEKVLRQQAALNPGHPRYRFDSDWYDTKLEKYEKYREAITSPIIS